VRSTHGGNIWSAAERLCVRPGRIVDASASLAPTPWWLPFSLSAASVRDLRAYPDPTYRGFRQALAGLHGLDPDWFLPGNGASELFTWAARDASSLGVSLLPRPGFADYSRALACWAGQASTYGLPDDWTSSGPRPLVLSGLQVESLSDGCLWFTNPHNPTGLLWQRRSLEDLLHQHPLVIADEAFLPLVPGGEAHSLIPLVSDHPNLVVIRSLTKLYGAAGLRLGYAVAHPERLQRWAAWRDPWPVNALASALAERLLGDRRGYEAHCRSVQRWTEREGQWLKSRLMGLDGLRPMPSAANFLLLRADGDRAGSSLQPLRLALERRHHILLRDCSSFEGLGPGWLRLGYQSRRVHRRLLRALRQELPLFDAA
jgi:histidinol-phosphate/aromatic aminotransferase/cobyric acid decarboxylase-like protein